MLSNSQNLLQAFIHDSPSLQLTAVYALQIFCHEKNFTKGMLLRAFVNCYEMDIMDERAFLQWKEDVNDTYPGKGKALFQVLINYRLDPNTVTTRKPDTGIPGSSKNWTFLCVVFECFQKQDILVQFLNGF